jgi:hypothetical protein
MDIARDCRNMDRGSGLRRHRWKNRDSRGEGQNRPTLFGASSFDELGLPGGDLADAGLDAPASGPGKFRDLVHEISGKRAREGSESEPRRRSGTDWTARDLWLEAPLLAGAIQAPTVIQGLDGSSSQSYFGHAD